MDPQKYKAIEEQFVTAFRALMMKYTEELLKVFFAEYRDLLPLPNPQLPENQSNGQKSGKDEYKMKNTWKERCVIGKRVRILIGLHKGRVGCIVDQKGAFVSVRMACGRTVNYLPKYLHINNGGPRKN